jgi:hypothetical protein
MSVFVLFVVGTGVRFLYLRRSLLSLHWGPGADGFVIKGEELISKILPFSDIGYFR